MTRRELHGRMFDHPDAPLANSMEQMEARHGRDARACGNTSGSVASGPTGRRGDRLHRKDLRCRSRSVRTHPGCGARPLPPRGWSGCLVPRKGFERMWRRRPLCFPRRTPGGRTSKRDPGRRRPVPQSPGMGVVATGRPGAASAQARAWYETDTSSWACKPTSRTTVAPLASGLPRRCGPSRKGVVAWGWPRSLLSPGPPPPWSPTERPQGCAARVPWRHQRRPGHDVRQGVMPLACFGRSVPQRCGPLSGPGQPGLGEETVVRCLPWACQPALWSPGVRLGFPGAAPSRPACRSAQAGWSLPSCTAPAPRPRAALPSPADRNAWGMERMHVTHGPPRGSARV
jgi:hypothetical protein